MSTDPHAASRDTLVNHILDADVDTPSALRRAASTNSDLPEDLAPLVDKIHRNAYKVIDEDIEAAKQHYSEDELFEVIVSAAVGASLERLNAGLRALEEAE